MPSVALSDDLLRLEVALRARGREARVVERTGSTNDDARAWASSGAPAGAVVVADAQDAGRGRHGRAWSSPKGESLALSVVLRPPVPPAALPPIALVAGLAARRAIGSRVAHAGVKWPNDVVVARAGGRPRKIAGVLVEGAISGRDVVHVVVGVGINVARRVFEGELAGLATSLALEGASDLDRGALALDLLDALDDELSRWLAAPSSIAERLAPHDVLRGREVSVSDRRGLADGIDPDGRLRVRVGDELVLAFAGEVHVEPGAER